MYPVGVKGALLVIVFCLAVACGGSGGGIVVLNGGGQWAVLAPLNEARTENSAAELNGFIYVVGGFASGITPALSPNVFSRCGPFNPMGGMS